MGAVMLSTWALIPEQVIAKDSQAASSENGGFKGPKADDTLNTVEVVMNASWLTDGMTVTVIGHVAESLGDDQYTFKDDTGQMTVKIDPSAWDGQKVAPKDKVKIIGKIAKNDSSSAVIVDSVEVMGK